MVAPTLKCVKTLWGVEDAAHPERWDALFAKIKSEGFDAVEAIAPTYRTKNFCSTLQAHGLSLVCQIHTTGGDIVDGEYQYCTSNKLHDHLASFVKLTAECAGLALKPVLINSHSGHDSWGSGDRAVAFLSQAIKIESALGVPVVHETHRQRLLYSPYSTAELLAKPQLEKLKINADLSHWCCVCEHVFDATDKRDDFWPETLALVAKHCHFVHCRVGHAEGPQISSISAPEWKAEADAHFSWWRTIWAAQAARVVAAQKEGGALIIWAEPEFGPPPYLQTLPYTGMPVGDLWDINKRVQKRMVAEFAAAMESGAPSAAAATPAASAAPAAAPAAKGESGGGGKSSGGGGGKPIENYSAQGASLLDVAKQNAAKEAKAAKDAAKAVEKKRKAVIKEGGKKGVEIEGASDMGGLEFFCTTLEEPDGDVELLQLGMSAMNAQPDPEAEDRKGCSGHVGKMIFSAGVEQLAIIAYVPAAKASKIDAAEWTKAVLEAVGGSVMMHPPSAAESSEAGTTVEAAVKADPDNGKYALKDKDLAMMAAFTFLRERGAFPEDNDDDSDEMIFGDDDNLDDYA